MILILAVCFTWILLIKAWFCWWEPGHSHYLEVTFPPSCPLPLAGQRPFALTDRRMTPFYPLCATCQRDDKREERRMRWRDEELSRIWQHTVGKRGREDQRKADRKDNIVCLSLWMAPLTRGITTFVALTYAALSDTCSSTGPENRHFNLLCWHLGQFFQFSYQPQLFPTHVSNQLDLFVTNASLTWLLPANDLCLVLH